MADKNELIRLGGLSFKKRKNTLILGILGNLGICH
jgi:hypothetical protein